MRSAGRFRRERARRHGTLAFVIYGEAAPRTWRETRVRDFDWHDAKGIVETLTRIPVVCARRDARPPMALVCDLIAEGKHIGILGQLEPAVAAIWIPQSQSSSGRLLSTRFGRCETVRLPGHSKVSPILRDIAVVCPVALSYGEIEKEIWETNIGIPYKVEPLSVYADPIRRKAARRIANPSRSP